MRNSESSSSLIDSRSGFCKSNSTFYSKHNPLSLPANPSLDVTTFISSQPHRGTTAFIDAATGYGLWTAVNRVADCLHHDIGIRRGDVVLLLSPNSMYFPVVCLSVMSLGAVVTTANTLNTAAEISRQISRRKLESNLSEKQVIDFISKQVAPYKKIRKVVFINSIPKSASGKTLRKELIKLATSKL